MTRQKWKQVEIPSTPSGWLDRARCQQDRFWSKVSINAEHECWPWTAGKDRAGYGKFQITGRGPRFTGDKPIQRHVRAHRLAWELINGPADPDLVTRHKCHNPAYCNPNHLELGTQKQNRNDCVVAGREPRGESKPLGKLTTEQVYQIRELAKTESTVAVIARTVGAPYFPVWAVVRGRYWRHVP